MSLFSGSSAPQLVEKDIEVVDPPPDSISCLSFSPVADYLAVGSWDNNVSLCFLITSLYPVFWIPIITLEWCERGTSGNPRDSHDCLDCR